MIKYKLTDQKMQTWGGYQWRESIWHEATGDISQGLCSDAWLHCYDSSLLAILHNPLHGDITNPRLFEVEVDGESKDNHGIKCGYRRMKIVREIPTPKISTVQRIAYGIICAKAVYHSEKWNIWADKWLSNEDRTDAAAADAATDAADAATDAAAADAATDAAAADAAAADAATDAAAADAATDAAAYATDAAAADAATDAAAADAAAADAATDAAAYATDAAYAAVDAATDAAAYATDAAYAAVDAAEIKTTTLNLVQIAEQVMKIE